LRRNELEEEEKIDEEEGTGIEVEEKKEIRRKK